METSAFSGINVVDVFDLLMEGNFSLIKLWLFLEIYTMRNIKGYEIYKKEIL